MLRQIRRLWFLGNRMRPFSAPDLIPGNTAPQFFNTYSCNASSRRPALGRWSGVASRQFSRDGGSRSLLKGRAIHILPEAAQSNQLLHNIWILIKCMRISSSSGKNRQGWDTLLFVSWSHCKIMSQLSSTFIVHDGNTYIACPHQIGWASNLATLFLRVHLLFWWQRCPLR